MKLENAELKHIEKIVAISKAAFDSDIDIGTSEAGGPPDYDSIPWHIQMRNEGHLLQAVIDGEIVGGAILFLDKDGETLYIGRIFMDPVHHRKGYGFSMMKIVETYYSGIKKIKLDTPLWNVRTNAFYTKLGYHEVKRMRDLLTTKKNYIDKFQFFEQLFGVLLVVLTSLYAPFSRSFASENSSSLSRAVFCFYNELS